MTLPATEPAALFVVLFATILVAPLLAERVRVPGVIGLLLAGAVIGPNALGIIERDGPVAALGSAGLLYLMFLGGLDLDIEGFAERRRESMVFGALTFAVPMAINTAVAVALGFELLAATLIASAFTSHTPIAYPILQRFGLTRHPAVTTTMGATLIAVVGALLVLAIVVAIEGGGLGALFWLRLVASFALLGAAVGLGLPRLTRWFFTGIGQDRNARLLFVLMVLFGTAMFSDLLGIEPIVGAFLAGLALNGFVGEGSAVMQRVQMFGSLLFIPLFLISTGMLVDPAALAVRPGILGTGVALTVSALVAKWLAAAPVAWWRGYDRAELGVMTALSSGQAAGALAAVIVGANVGLVGTEAVNATVLVMLGTCLVAPALAARAAPRVHQEPQRARRIGEVVVVPVANPETAGPLVRIAAHVAGPDRGQVVPCTVVGEDADDATLAERRAVTADAERAALAVGAEATSHVRIDASPTAGVIHTAVETGATALLMGWKGYSTTREHFFGGVIDNILSRSPVPVLVCRPSIEPEPIRRVVLSVTPGDLAPAGLPGLELAVRVAERVARQADAPLAVISEEEDVDDLVALLAEPQRAEIVHDGRKPSLALRDRTAAGDVIVLGTPPTHAGVSQNAQRVARAVPARTLVAVLPRNSGASLPGRQL